MWRRLVPRALALAALLALVPAARAEALSCGAPARPYSETADVVFDGVLLSGPREEPLGRLASPARMHVFRYLKGRGPRVVEIGTDVPLLTPGDDVGVFSWGPAMFEPHPGEVYRVYGDTPAGAGRSAGRGVLTPHACGGTYERRIGSFLRGVRGSRVAERDPGGRRWAAELLRGAGGVRCVRVHPGPAADHIECERFDRFRPVVAAVVPAGGDTWATALVVARPGLETITVEGSFGRIERAAGPAGVALVVLPGYFERTDLTVTARFAGGGTRRVLGLGRVVVPHPHQPERSWGFAFARVHPPTPTVCIAFAERPQRPPPSTVLTAPRHGECGNGDYGFFAVRYVYRHPDGRRAKDSTVVFGMGRWASSVTIAGPDGERVMPTGPGGIFAAVYPPDVGHEDLTVSFDLYGVGEDATFRGRRDAGVLRPPRSELDGDRRR